MGICIQYRTTDPVKPRTAKAILGDLDRANSSREWLLCEPIGFLPIEEDGRLCGRSKLHLLPNADELSAFQQLDTGDSDLQALVTALCTWSERHGVVWELELEGEPIGRIRHGRCDERIRGMIESMVGLAVEFGGLSADELFGTEEQHPAGPTLRLWRPPEEDEG